MHDINLCIEVIRGMERQDSEENPGRISITFQVRTYGPGSDP